MGNPNPNHSFGLEAASRVDDNGGCKRHDFDQATVAGVMRNRLDHFLQSRANCSIVGQWTGCIPILDAIDVDVEAGLNSSRSHGIIGCPFTLDVVRKNLTEGVVLLNQFSNALGHSKFTTSIPASAPEEANKM
jgi:hypothetical protein